jgi:hypothetical protein
MNFRRIFPIFVSLLFSTASACTPNQPDYPEGRAEADLRFLADDSLEGRGTPSHGLDVAGLYLANQLRAAGWEPPGEGSYLQPYEVGIFDPAAAEIRVSINGVVLEGGQFAFMSLGLRPDESPVEYDLVLAGYGVSVPEEGVDDFEDLEVAGKAVVAFLGAPWELDPSVIHAPDHGIGKAVQARVRDARMFVYVSEEFSAGFSGEPGAEVGLINSYAHSPLTQLIENSRTSAFNTPFLAIGPEVFDRTLAGAAGGTYAEMQVRLAGGESVKGDIAASIRVEIDAATARGVANNVVAILPGANPELRDEWVILTAHYDHLGAYDAPPGEDGIFNGADDNASGTAAVLEVARRLAAEGPLDRSVVVAFFSGEEMGLVGSAYYTAHPLVPLEQTVLDINVDMVGRSDGTVQALTPGSEELYQKTTELGRAAGMIILPDQQPTWRLSYFLDGYHFARNDIPLISVFTALHGDYHQVGDEIEKIRFEEFDRIVEVIGALAEYYARGGALPAYERPTWFLTPR